MFRVALRICTCAFTLEALCFHACLWLNIPTCSTSSNLFIQLLAFSRVRGSWSHARGNNCCASTCLVPSHYSLNISPSCFAHSCLVPTLSIALVLVLGLPASYIKYCTCSCTWRAWFLLTTVTLLRTSELVAFAFI